jgi:hypothetical protein
MNPANSFSPASFATQPKQSCKLCNRPRRRPRPRPRKLGGFYVVELTPKSTRGRRSPLGAAKRHTIEDEDDDEDEYDLLFHPISP